MTRDELLTLTQRLREYNHNPHHINPVSDAFHKLIVDAANALSAVAAVWGCLAIPDGWRIERRELDGSVCFIIGAPRMAGVRSNTSVWLSDSDPAHLLLWHLLAAAPAQPAAQDQVDQQEGLHVWRATSRLGYTCHFGEASAARAWAGENGTIERVDLTPVHDLQVVERQDQSEVQRLREALEGVVKRCSKEHGGSGYVGQDGQYLKVIDAALAASTGQEVKP